MQIFFSKTHATMAFLFLMAVGGGCSKNSSLSHFAGEGTLRSTESIPKNHVKSISAGYGHTCALTDAGVRCRTLIMQ